MDVYLVYLFLPDYADFDGKGASEYLRRELVSFFGDRALNLLFRDLGKFVKDYNGRDHRPSERTPSGLVNAGYKLISPCPGLLFEKVHLNDSFPYVPLLSPEGLSYKKSRNLSGSRK